MKSLGLCLLNIALLAMLVACGKENESGKSSSYSCGANGNYNCYTGYPGTNGGYNWNNPYNQGYNGGGVNIPSTNLPPVVYNLVQNYRCSSTGASTRIPISIPLTNTPFVVSSGDYHVGVTSFGDVAMIVGQATGQPPLFVGFMCPRSFTSSGQGQLANIGFGSASARCPGIKQLTRATVVFPGGGTAEFREITFGAYLSGQPFTPYCQ